MKKKLSFDYSAAQPYILPHEVSQMAAPTEAAAKLLESRKGPGNEFLGWLDLPQRYDRTEFKRIKLAAKRIQQQSEVLVVIGTLGSMPNCKKFVNW